MSDLIKVIDWLGETILPTSFENMRKKLGEPYSHFLKEEICLASSNQESALKSQWR